jgi:hypothetical protein
MCAEQFCLYGSSDHSRRRWARYRFTLDPDAVIGIKPQITLPANGIPATLERR